MLKKRDPQIYEDKKFFENLPEDDAGSRLALKALPEKKYTLKDLERETLLKEGPEAFAEEEALPGKTFVQEQRDLKRKFLEAAAELSEEGNPM